MRKPDVVIGDKYLNRWYLIPRNKWFNVYLHQFLGSDDDRALHDHPWISVSFLLKGVLYEHLEGWSRVIIPYLPYFRGATLLHRMELISDEAWTLFITGPRVRRWGFMCPKGWVDKEDFLEKGCD